MDLWTRYFCTAFYSHPVAWNEMGFPGPAYPRRYMGCPRLGAEFIAATGGDMDAFGSADRLAGFAGLASRPRDSGRVSGNLRRPKRYHRGLLRSMYLSATVSMTTWPASKAFYQRKRDEGKGHKQALLALARRRLNVLWAMIRDGECYQGSSPVAVAA